MRTRIPTLSLLAYLTVWTALAIAPQYRADWFLENLPTLVVVPVAVLLHRRIHFSDRACVQAALFGVLHAIGSHYTYSEVPLGDWLRDVLGLGRNHYDRVVHFAFGMLAVRPLRELAFPRGAHLSLQRQLVLTVSLVASIGLAYEILEWLVAIVADPAAGTAFLGTQGDPWDAQKDTALGCLGAALALPAELFDAGPGSAAQSHGNVVPLHVVRRTGRSAGRGPSSRLDPPGPSRAS